MYSSKDNWDETTWRVALDWEVSDTSLLYGSVATGYKSEGLGSGTPLSYDEENLINYELSSKNDLLDGSLQPNAAVFYSEYDDMQVTQVEDTGDGVLVSRTRNAAESSIFGTEVELTWLPTENSRLQGFLTYLDAEFDDFPSTADEVFNPGVIEGHSGHKLAMAPEFSFTAVYDIEWNLADRGSIRPRVSVAWQDEYYLRTANRSPDDEQDSHTVVDASLRYTSPDQNWSVELFGKSLTDEDVKVNASGLAGDGVLTYRYKPPHTYGVRFDYTFGE